MMFSFTVQGIREQGLSPIWQMAENYLHVGQKINKITLIKDGQTYCKEETSKLKFIWTALKVVSFVTFFLPLIAACIVAYNRRKYVFSLADPKEIADQKKAALHLMLKISTRLREDLESWISGFESKRNKVLKELEVEGLAPKGNVGDLEKEKKSLTTDFSSLPSYFTHQDHAIATTKLALQQLLDGKCDKTSVDFARSVYKTASAFLRKNSDPSHLREWKEYLSGIAQQSMSFGFIGASNPQCYVLAAVKNVSGEIYRKHAAFIHLLKNLRKRIKLVTKQNKIDDLLLRQNCCKDVSPQDISKARKYLVMTWLHGTKASVIKSACEQSEGALLPTGELVRRHIRPLTGEMDIGSTAIGINIKNLSGVNLAMAFEAIDYANRFMFRLDEEKRFYHWIMNKTFSNFEDCLDRGSCSRSVQALYRIQSLVPEELDFQGLARKLQEMYAAVDKVFSEKPREIFGWHDNYYTSKFYSFLIFLKSFEEFLAAPIDRGITEEEVDLAKCPLIVGSSKKVGMPVQLSCYQESGEEVLGEPMKLGRDIDVVFTTKKCLDAVQRLVHHYGLGESVAVEPIEVLDAARRMDRALGPYFYDYYNQKKWEKELAYL